MRKLFMTFSLILTVILAGCSTVLNSTNNPESNSTDNTTTNTDQIESGVKLNANHSQAFSSYMASGLLANS